MKPTLIVDVRSPLEYARAHIEGAVNIPLDVIEQKIGSIAGLDKSSDILLYCLSGARSGIAVSILVQMGFTGARNGGAFATLAMNYKSTSANVLA